MLAKYERRFFDNTIKVWVGTYFNLQNIVHWHNEAEFIYVKEGSIRVGINSDIHHATKGDILLATSGDVHYIYTDENSQVDILIFESTILKPRLNAYRLQTPHIPKKALEQKNINPNDFISSIRYELDEKREFFEDYVVSLIRCFMALVFRDFKTEKIEIKEDVRQNSLINSYQCLINHIDIHYADIDFKTAAEFMHFTPSYFSAVFKNIAAMTFTQYLQYVRMAKAVEMIKSADKSIISIATECGFDSVRHFNRVFKDLTGTTPTKIDADFQFSINPTKANTEAFDPTVGGKKSVF